MKKAFTNYNFPLQKQERQNLIKLASKIKKIPDRFAKPDGSLDLDKVNLVLMDYHRKMK